MAYPTPIRGRGVSGLMGEFGGRGVKADTMDQPSNILLSPASRHINVGLQEIMVWERKPSVTKVTTDKISHVIWHGRCIVLPSTSLSCSCVDRTLRARNAWLQYDHFTYVTCLWMKRIQDKCLFLRHSLKINCNVDCNTLCFNKQKRKIQN